jgi:hypothetical protein
MKRNWTVRRTKVARVDAARRWDQAYLHLLRWAPQKETTKKEVPDARGDLRKEGHQMDLGKLPTRPGYENLPRCWVAERTFAWISHNRRMAKDYERMCSTGEAFIHAAMTRLIVRRLARA